MKKIFAITICLYLFSFIKCQPTSSGQTSGSTGMATTYPSQTKCDKVTAQMYQNTTSTTRTIYGYGCPGYDWTKQVTPDSGYASYFSWSFPLTPVISASKYYIGIYGANKVTNSNPLQGNIGITYNGIALQSNTNAFGADAYLNEYQTLDYCGGHNNPQSIYHLHNNVANGCGYSNTSGVSHSPFFAMMIDGIPLFGPYGDNGVIPKDLDECGGHVDSTYPWYHYHLPSGQAVYPYTIVCLRGCIFNSQGNKGVSSQVVTPSTCVQNATQYNYSTLTNAIPNYFTTTGVTGVTTNGTYNGTAISASVAPSVVCANYASATNTTGSCQTSQSSTNASSSKSNNSTKLVISFVMILAILALIYNH